MMIRAASAIVLVDNLSGSVPGFPDVDKGMPEKMTGKVATVQSQKTINWEDHIPVKLALVAISSRVER